MIMLNNDNFKTLSKISSDLEILGEILEEIADHEMRRNMFDEAKNTASFELVWRTYDAVIQAVKLLEIIEYIEDEENHD